MMEIRPFGDRAVVALFRGGEREQPPLRQTAGLAALLRIYREPWITDIVPAYETVTIIYDPYRLPLRGMPAEAASYRYVEKWIYEQIRLYPLPETGEAGRTVELPVCYGGTYGPDLAEAASRAGLSEREYVSLHAGAVYPAAMIGFMPGFPYLSGLPAELDQPRKAAPRLSVPAGSVAVAAGQTCVYPFETPGGWQIVGRTPVRMFDPYRVEPALINAGDSVRFVPVSEAEFIRLEADIRGQAGLPEEGGDPDEPIKPDESAADTVCEGIGEQAGLTGLRVLRPGLATTIQDSGRSGFRHLGVGTGGAMDDYALKVSNLLVGNDTSCAVLEMALTGAELLAETDLLIALCGAYMEPTADGEELPMWRPVLVKRGAVIRLRGALSGSRVYLAAAGGIGAPKVMGSRSTDVRAGLGGLAGRRLAAGDAVPCGAAGGAAAPSGWAAAWMAALERNRAAAEAQAGRPVRWAAAPWYAPPAAYGGGSEDGIELRAMPGAGRPMEAAALFRERYEAAPASDRMGLRLAGPPIESGTRAELLSHGVTPGAVQLPPGGAPIVLAADCQTTGGYPVIAHVASVDMPLLAQVRPGDAIRFVPVTLEEAQRLDRARGQELRALAAAIRCRLPSSAARVIPCSG